MARRLGEAVLITCAAPANLKQFGTPAYPEELKNGHRLVAYVSSDTGRAFPFRFERDGRKTEITVDHRVGINESNAHLAACVAGWASSRRLAMPPPHRCRRARWWRCCEPGARRRIRSSSCTRRPAT